MRRSLKSVDFKLSVFPWEGEGREGEREVTEDVNAIAIVGRLTLSSSQLFLNAGAKSKARSLRSL